MSLLQTLKDAAEKLMKQMAPIDPRQFEDPVAMQTAWTPAKSGGASFGTHRLVEVDSTRFVMKKSLWSFLFGGLFLAVGIGVFIGGIVKSFWPMMLFGTVFAAVGGWVAYPTSLVFDGNTRQVAHRKGPISFSAIHAIQLLKEYVRGDKKSYWSYELNLVMKDGQRVNIVDHGNLPLIQKEAKTLQQLIGCKVWDGTVG